VGWGGNNGGTARHEIARKHRLRQQNFKFSLSTISELQPRGVYRLQSGGSICGFPAIHPNQGNSTKSVTKKWLTLNRSKRLFRKSLCGNLVNLSKIGADCRPGTWLIGRPPVQPRFAPPGHPHERLDDNFDAASLDVITPDASHKAIDQQDCRNPTLWAINAVPQAAR